ncbi:MAG TPA: SRPBCC family protein [Gemmatimonadales bacterium]|nr:SRPBCC family protein [Gemmatimonadales bacterium]
MASTARTGVTGFTTPTDLEIVITRVVDAPRRLVFDAFTDPKHVPHWLTGPEGWTMPVCEIDLRPGGAWRYVYRKAGGSEMTLHGTFLEVAPPGRVVATESWGPEWPETVNTTELAESGRQTTITITVRYPSKAARDEALRTGAADGMDRSFARLDALLETLV